MAYCILHPTPAPGPILLPDTSARCPTCRGHLQGYKPRSSHLHRTSYYVLCHGWDPTTAVQLGFIERLSSLTVLLRKKGDSPVLVPFAEMPEGQPKGLGDIWGVALLHFHQPLWMFQTLMRLAIQVGGRELVQGLSADTWMHVMHVCTGVLVPCQVIADSCAPALMVPAPFSSDPSSAAWCLVPQSPDLLASARPPPPPCSPTGG